MFEWLKKMGKSKKMKHEIIVNAESLETRVAIMADGHILEYGASEQLMRDPQTERAQRFLRAVRNR